MGVTAARLVSLRPRVIRMAALPISAACIAMEPIVLSRTDFEDGSYIEVLEPANGGEMYYRTCFKGVCRYSSDQWQSEVYRHQMTSPSLPQ